jgi:uncharacterized delta-60 repeat protein
MALNIRVRRRIVAVVCAVLSMCAVVRAQSLDTNFNPGANGIVMALAVQPDGKILVGGMFTRLGGGGTGTTTRNHLGRLNADGSLDVSFDPGANGDVYAFAVQADGKILVGGWFTTLGGGGTGTTTRNCLGRLNADGSLDATFNPGATNAINALALQPDGKIVVGGFFFTLGGGGTGTTARSMIGRLNADGSLDTGFNPGANDSVEALSLQPDGKILVGGMFTRLGGGGMGTTTRNQLGRLNADGSLDTSFDPGVGSIPLRSPSVPAVAVQPDGKILVGGGFTRLGGGGTGTTARNNLGRLNADGSLDADFDPGVSGMVRAFVVQPDGKILVGGVFTRLGGGGTGTTARNNLGRLNADGSLDTNFDPGANYSVWALASQADGGILIGGFFTTLGGGGTGTTTRQRIGRLAPSAPRCQVSPMPTLYYQGDLSSAVPHPLFGLDPGCKTSDYGCALVTVSNMLRSFADPLLATYLPTVLNDRLKLDAVAGYYDVCDLRFAKIPTATDSRVTMVVKPVASADLDGYLEQNFCDGGDRAILRLNQYVDGGQTATSHFVFVIGRDSSGDWTVFDPGWTEPTPQNAGSSLREHLNGFTTNKAGKATFRRFEVADVRLFAANPTPMPGSLSVGALSPVELLVTDPQGRRLGWSESEDIFEIPQGSYFRDFPLGNADGDGVGPGESSGRKTAYIPLPESGNYTVRVVGTALGTYTLEFRTVAADGTAREMRLSGVANVGSSAPFAVAYSALPTSPLEASRITTFEGMSADIDNSLRLGLIDNAGIANSLLRKLRAAQRTSGPARDNILQALKNEVEAQSGTHILGIAAEILLQDIDSLSGQNR